MAIHTERHAIEVLRMHTDGQLRLHAIPGPNAGMQIIPRPFPTYCEPHLLEADGILYRDPITGPLLRRQMLVDAILGRTEIEVDIAGSYYTDYENEEIREKFGGVDSTLALATRVRGRCGWLAITNYHLTERLRNGEERVARYMGAKVLGPALFATRRPTTLSAINKGRKLIPAEPVDDTGSNDRDYEWFPVEGNETSVEIITGVDVARFRK